MRLFVTPFPTYHIYRERERRKLTRSRRRILARIALDLSNYVRDLGFRWHDRDVLAQLLEDVLIATPESFARGRQDDDRDHSPEDPEHRQKAAQLVCRNRPKHLVKRVAECLHIRSTLPFPIRLSERDGSPTPKA